MMLATEIRHLAHLCVSFILFSDKILLNNANLTSMFNLQGHENIFIWLGILITTAKDLKFRVLAHFNRTLRLIVILQSTIVVLKVMMH